MNETNLDERLQKLEDQMRQVLERNAKVEIDKAWEISKFRILSICGLTWVIMSLVFWMIGVDAYFLNAIIPSLGFYLSNRSLPVLKKLWVERRVSKSFTK